MNDALVEIWQANAHGRYAHPDDTQDQPLEPGFTRLRPRADRRAAARFRFTTIKPGRVPGADGKPQAPHLNVTIFMRGHAQAPVHAHLLPGRPGQRRRPGARTRAGARRATLIARATKPGVVAWDVILQGDGETVFFEC